VTIGRLCSRKLRIQVRPPIRFGRIDRFEQGCVLVGGARGRQGTRRVDMGLQLCANCRIGKIGHALQRDPPLADIQ